MLLPLPKPFLWLANEPGPKMLKIALEFHGLKEKAGSANNPVIMGWAKETGAKGYNADSVPWCGLFASVIALRATWPHNPLGNALWARNWAAWGVAVAIKDAMLGDILVFVRDGGGHVGLYVGEDDLHFYVLGGNQGDAVSIIKKLKKDCIAARRAPWRISQPANVRKVFMSVAGPVSTNEA